MTSQGELRLLH